MARRHERVLERAEALFSALCEGNRLALLLELCRSKKPCPVSALARCCTIDLSVVSRHLAVLKRASVVEAERHGREVLYSVDPTALATTLRDLADAIEGAAGNAKGARA